MAKWLEIMETKLPGSTDLSKVSKFCSRDTNLFLQTWGDESVGDLIWHGDEEDASISLTNDRPDYNYLDMFDESLTSIWHSNGNHNGIESQVTIIFKV